MDLVPQYLTFKISYVLIVERVFVACARNGVIRPAQGFREIRYLKVNLI